MASAVAAVELVLLLVLGVALVAKPVSEHVREAAEERAFAPVKPAVAKPKPQPVGAPKLARSETSVLVLNGNGRNGAAAAQAERARARGYLIADVGDAPRTDFVRTTVMYRPGYAAEGKRLAADLRIKVVGPLDGMKPAALMGAHAVVVVGA